MGSSRDNIFNSDNIDFATLRYFRIDQGSSDRGYLTDNRVLLMAGSDFNNALKNCISEYFIQSIQRIVYEPWATFHTTYSEIEWDSGTNVDASNVGLIKAFYDGSCTVYICPNPHLKTIYVNPDAALMYNGFNISSLPTVEDGLTVSWELVTTMHSCFADSSIATVDSSADAHCNTVNCTDFTSAFSGCTTLTSFDFSVFDFDAASTMKEFFNGCEALHSVENTAMAQTQNATNFSYMFANCLSLKKVTFQLKTDNATTFAYMFSQSGVTTFAPKGWNTENVTTFSYMFYRTPIATFQPEGWDTRNATTFAYMFGMHKGDINNGVYTPALTTFGPFNWDTSKVTSMTGMFMNCQALITVNLDNFSNTSLSSIQKMFSGCTSLERIYVTKYDEETKKGWNNKWRESDGDVSKNTFEDCSASLIGGNDTTNTDRNTPWNKDNIGDSYAIANNYKGAENPDDVIRGYFTLRDATDPIEPEKAKTSTMQDGKTVKSKYDSVSTGPWDTTGSPTIGQKHIVHIVIGGYESLVKGNSALENIFANNSVDVSMEQNETVIMFGYYDNTKDELTVYIVFKEPLN